MTGRRDDVEAAAHVPIVVAALSVQRAVWQDFNLRAAWPWFDPTLRLCLVQRWLHPQLAALRRVGYDRDETVAALVADDPRHRLWCMFEVGMIKALDEGAPGDIGGWVPTLNTEAVAPDIERLALHQPAASGDFSQCDWAPLLLRFTEGVGWRLLSLNEDVPVPVPGWPPTM